MIVALERGAELAVVMAMDVYTEVTIENLQFEAEVA